MFTKQELTPHALELFRCVKAALPVVIGERLRSHRSFVTHPNFKSLFLFAVWDRNQKDVLHRDHFKYCLNYDGRPGAKYIGNLSLWLTKIRIYRDRDAILPILEREVPRLVPKGFAFDLHDRAFRVTCGFDYPSDLSKLPDLLLARFVSLVTAYHPLLVTIIDRFTTPLAPGERRALVAQRGRIPYTPTGPYRRDHVREYTRSIPSSWRPLILDRSGYLCANSTCRADLRQVPHHIDHIVPFSKGGPTILENLQALCGPCNLAKGNRELTTDT